MRFIDKLILRLEKANSSVCVGLDSRYDKIPEFLKTSNIKDSVFEFNKAVVEATNDLVCAYKSNIAFYAGFGREGLEALFETNRFMRENFPDIPLIADCKRSEMGESVEMVKRELFDWLGFDCVMVTPWFGFDTIKDYLSSSEHGVCVYIHDSNPTATEFQDLKLATGEKLYEYVAETVSKKWNTNGNVFSEAGLTYPLELKRIREIIGEEMPLLVAGLGAQGGKIEDLTGLFGKDKNRLLVNSSRGIIFSGKSHNKEEYFKEVHIAAKNIFNAINNLKKY